MSDTPNHHVGVLDRHVPGAHLDANAAGRLLGGGDCRVKKDARNREHQCGTHDPRLNGGASAVTDAVCCPDGCTDQEQTVP